MTTTAQLIQRELRKGWAPPGGGHLQSNLGRARQHGASCPPGVLLCLQEEQTGDAVMSKLALTLFYLLYNLKYIRKVFIFHKPQEKTSTSHRTVLK